MHDAFGLGDDIREQAEKEGSLVITGGKGIYVIDENGNEIKPLPFIVVIIDDGWRRRLVHRPAGQLALQGVDVDRRGVVLQLPRDLRLFCLLPATPHGGPPCSKKRGGR